MKISIQEKMKEKNITRYELAKRLNITYPTMDKIFKGETSSIRFDILEGLCSVLECTPNDILDYNPHQMINLLPDFNNNQDDTSK